MDTTQAVLQEPAEKHDPGCLEHSDIVYLSEISLASVPQRFTSTTEC